MTEQDGPIALRRLGQENLGHGLRGRRRLGPGVIEKVHLSPAFSKGEEVMHDLLPEGRVGKG
jgi:hypothetical protein